MKRERLQFIRYVMPKWQRLTDTQFLVDQVSSHKEKIIWGEVNDKVLDVDDVH